jgi:hypothetical protein
MNSFVYTKEMTDDMNVIGYRTGGKQIFETHSRIRNRNNFPLPPPELMNLNTAS